MTKNTYYTLNHGYKSLAQLITWGLYLRMQKAEVLETLQEENVTHEALYIYWPERILECVMVGDNIKPANLQRSLNRRHRRLMHHNLRKMLPPLKPLERKRITIYSFSANQTDSA